MRALAKRTKQSVRVGDWIKTERGRIFEVARIVDEDERYMGPSDYGPNYMDDLVGSALACAVVEIRRASSGRRPTKGDE